MLRNHLKSMAFVLGLTTLVGIAEAMIAGVLVPHTIIRIPVLVPGPQLANFTVPMTGVQCMRHCTDTPNCMYIVTRPVSWPDFDKINENKNMYFIEKLRRTELVGCWLFARRGDGKRGTPWIGRGAKQMGKNGECRYGNLLLAAKRWMEPETGRFNPDDFLALEETPYFGYADDEFRQELENQRPPLCTFTPTVSSTPTTTPGVGTHGTSPRTNPLTTSTPVNPTRGPEDAPSETESASTSSTEGDEANPRTESDVQEAETTTSPTTDRAIHTTQEPRGVGLSSYICKKEVLIGFNFNQCSDPQEMQVLLLSTLLFPKTVAEVGEGCTPMPVMFNVILNKLQTTTDALAEAYCSKAKCGSLVVPVGKKRVYVPELVKNFDTFTEVSESDAPICYVFQSISRM